METSYKEKYEQALAHAREIHRNEDEKRRDMEFIFPELKKSEDEKIRKRLITDFGTIGKKEWGGLEVKDILAWLEKQGEHANFRNKIQVGDKVTRNEDGVLVNLSQLKRVAKPSEKQGKKHPEPYNGISFEYNGHIWGMCARDNGVDISCDKHLIKHLEEQGEKLPVGFYYVNSEGKKFYSDTLKYGDVTLHVEKQGEQKPEENKGNIVGISAEWSEEDEVKINRIVACLENLNVADNDILLKDIDWLKSIKDRVQPKQEWSEDDKRKIDRIYSILRQAADTHAFSTSCRLIGDKECMELQDWLKSLRPQSHWKPSDEQIKVCKEVYADLLSAKGFDLGTVVSELNRLEEGLKKKGE